ncbi:TBPIP-domain-containing protein [Thelephora terrestris]|uniref:TBPIP-domain-containing protein n=1 Tax=Thelephora terrestris TaxID=56493 RepID=A0A9P6L9C4_9AGAM|nr:TBPIP-domain-containing protein [Thelephora terrestris]
MTSGKKSEAKVATLKGPEAEETVLQYLKRVRKYGAAVLANTLKVASPDESPVRRRRCFFKPERGRTKDGNTEDSSDPRREGRDNTEDIRCPAAYTHLFLGKSTFFVYNQSKIDNLPAEKLVTLEAQLKEAEEENKLLAAEVKSLSAELGKIKSAPTDAELGGQVAHTEEKIATTLKYLEPLRAGSSIISASELTQLDEDWKRWRQEWLSRRKIRANPPRLRDATLEAMGPKEAAELLEDLGVEMDSPEHAQLERSCLCARASGSRN